MYGAVRKSCQGRFDASNNICIKLHELDQWTNILTWSQGFSFSFLLKWNLAVKQEQWAAIQQEKNTSGEYRTESHFHGNTKVKISPSVLIGGYMSFNNYMNQYIWLVLIIASTNSLWGKICPSLPAWRISYEMNTKTQCKCSMVNWSIFSFTERVCQLWLQFQKIYFMRF